MNVSQNTLHCYHCGDICLSKKWQFEDKYFCCNGCQTVFQILNQNDMCAYYDLNQNPGLSNKDGIRTNKYDFLELPDFKTKWIQFSDANKSHITFYIPQMHCSSCLWVLERLYKLNPGVIESSVNFKSKELFVVFDHNNLSLKELVILLSNIGYEPILELDKEESEIKKNIARKRLYKIGVAGFCFSNIMMLSFPEYLTVSNEVSSQLSRGFQILALFLSIPVLGYAGSEFFISAYKGLKHRIINIDFPVAAALAITFIRSLYEIQHTLGIGYLDSMSGVVFFLLIGRWLQEKTETHIVFNREFTSFLPIAVFKKNENGFAPENIKNIQKNDILKIHSQEIIPVDGILSKGNAMLDYSFVTGESQIVASQIGEVIYAGAKQTQGAIEIIASHSVSQSYLNSLWNKNRNTTESIKEKFEDVLSQYFSLFVFILGISAGVYWYFNNEMQLMWNAMTTVFIIACPCALLLATNFTNGNIMRLLNHWGMYLKNADVLSQLQEIRHIVFDKTGTITHHHDDQISFEGSLLNEEEISHIAQILWQSKHPIAQAVFQFLKIPVEKTTITIQEIEGKGIKAKVNNFEFMLGSAIFVGLENEVIENASVLYVKINEEIKGKFLIHKAFRDGALEMINGFSKHYYTTILSGDSNYQEPFLKSHLSNTNLFFLQKPEDKLQYIEQIQRQNQNVLMVGDGLNDALALSKSHVGIAVAEDFNTFTPAAKAILKAKNVTQLPKIIEFVHFGKLVIWTCFIFSIIFNVIGLFYAVQGTLKPIIAAILMTSSSIGIILISYGLSSLKMKQLKS